MADSALRKQWKNAKGKLHKTIAGTLPKKDLGPNLDTHAKYFEKVRKNLDGSRDVGKSAVKDVDAILKSKKKIDAAVKEYSSTLDKLIKAGDPKNEVTQDVMNARSELAAIAKDIETRHSKAMKEWGLLRQKKK